MDIPHLLSYHLFHDDYGSFQFVAIENNFAVNILVLVFLVPNVCVCIVYVSRDKTSGHMVCMCSSSVDTAQQFIRLYQFKLPQVLYDNASCSFQSITVIILAFIFLLIQLF